MGRKSPKQKKLTDYESCQVEKIAAWKAAFPNPFGELFRRGAEPIAKVVEIIIPDRVALLSIEAAYKSSVLAATKGDIWLDAGVADITKLRHEPLEVCDRLARRVGSFAQGVATIEGVLTGAGGVWTTLVDIPLLFGLCLRTIIKIGYCYGYALDQPTDKAWVLGAFAVVLSSTKQKRLELTARLREIEDLMIEETEEQVVVEEAAALLHADRSLPRYSRLRRCHGSHIELLGSPQDGRDRPAPLSGALVARQRQGRCGPAGPRRHQYSFPTRVVRCLCAGRVYYGPWSRVLRDLPGLSRYHDPAFGEPAAHLETPRERLGTGHNAGHRY